jgi:stress response protein YsnF
MPGGVYARSGLHLKKETSKVATLPSEEVATQPYRAEHEVSGTRADAPRREPSGDTVEVPLSEEEVKPPNRSTCLLKHEHIVVERVAAHEVGSSGTESFREEQIKVKLSREEPVVEKETHVFGGVRKTQGVEQETVREECPTRRR